MIYIVVVDIHQHSDRLANDEREPHGGVAIVSSQESTHKPSQRNLHRLNLRVICVLFVMMMMVMC